VKINGRDETFDKRGVEQCQKKNTRVEPPWTRTLQGDQELLSRKYAGGKGGVIFLRSIGQLSGNHLDRGGGGPDRDK